MLVQCQNATIMLIPSSQSRSNSRTMTGLLPKPLGKPRIFEYEVGNCTKEVVKAPTNKCPIAILFHDESTFQTHDAQEKSWVLDSLYQLRKKGLVGAYTLRLYWSDKGLMQGGCRLTTGRIMTGIGQGKMSTSSWEGDPSAWKAASRLSTFIYLRQFIRSREFCIRYTRSWTSVQGGKGSKWWSILMIKGYLLLPLIINIAYATALFN